MRSVEVVGKNKEEAVEKALADLGLKRSQVEVEVVDEGNRGWLGFMGSRPVRVRVQELSESDREPVAVVRTLLEMMDVDFQLEVSRQDDSTHIRVLSEKDDGLLIGRRGQTLDALRHLAQRIIAARLGRNVVVNIDIGDYRARREDGLRARAQDAADAVLKSGRNVSLEPMSAQDRRVIHLELAERGDVHTYTVGSGARRRVVVALESKRGGAGQERRDRSQRGETFEKDEARTVPFQEDVIPQFETAYDEVPDPGFRPTRLSDGSGEGLSTPPEGPRASAGRERRRSRGPRRQGRDSGERDARDSRGSSRTHERGRREDMQQAQRDGARPPREEHQPPREERHRDRPGRERRDSGARDSQRESQRAFQEEKARQEIQDHGITETEPLGTDPEIPDHSERKPFSSDLARQVLQIGDNNGSSSKTSGSAVGRRRSRRR